MPLPFWVILAIATHYSGVIIPTTSADNIVAQDLFTTTVVLKALSLCRQIWLLYYGNWAQKCASSKLGEWHWQGLAKADGNTYLTAAFMKGTSHLQMKHVDVKQLGHVEQSKHLSRGGIFSSPHWFYQEPQKTGDLFYWRAKWLQAPWFLQALVSSSEQ